MPGSTTDAREWLDHQVAKFTDVYPVYRTFGRTLDQVLALAAGGLSGHAIIQIRSYQRSIFLENARRKQRGVALYAYGRHTTFQKLETWTIEPTNQGFHKAMFDQVWKVK